jgi:hypothetical protein
MFLPRLNPIEPPWYGPVCPVVWEGRRREASPYPDPCPRAAVAVAKEPRGRIEIGEWALTSIEMIDSPLEASRELQ